MTDQLPDDANIECPYQTIARGYLKCKCANTSGQYSTHETSDIICHKCPAGKIYREVGCDAFTAETHLLRGSNDSLHIGNILCIKRKRDTTLEYCRTCTLVSAPTTKEITGTVKGLFETEKFYTAYKDLETARKCLRDGDYDGAITSSVSCLESVIKTILDRMDIQYPSDEAVTSLWKAVRVPLQLDTIISTEHTIALLGNLTGTVQYLGGMRNKISDAHGKGEVAPEVPYMLAELAINSASVITTLLIRRYIQLRSS